MEIIIIAGLLCAAVALPLVLSLILFGPLFSMDDDHQASRLNRKDSEVVAENPTPVGQRLGHVYILISPSYSHRAPVVGVSRTGKTVRVKFNNRFGRRKYRNRPFWEVCY